MQLVQKKINEIKPYWRNARHNERTVEAVIDSIKEYGYVAPIIVDEKGVIITGHARYKALVRLGIEEIQVIISDMDARKAKEYRIIDNKTSEIAGWDTKLLTAELREFADLSKFIVHFPELKLPTINTDILGTNKKNNYIEPTDEEIKESEDKLKNQFQEASER